MKEYSDFVINKINSMSDKEFEDLLKESGIDNCPEIKSDSNYVSNYQFIYSATQIVKYKFAEISFEVKYEANKFVVSYNSIPLSEKGIPLDDTSKAA